MDHAGNKNEEYIQSLKTFWSRYEEYVAAVNEDNLNKHRDVIKEITNGKSLLNLLFFTKRPVAPKYIKPDFKGFLNWLGKTRLS
jgi:hypothetical protein